MSRIGHSLLRIRDKNKASVSYSELLFDLIYVFAVTQLSHYFLHHLTWLGFVQGGILWAGIWMAWQHTTWVTNWFNPDTRIIRILLFALMILGLIVAAAIPDAFGERAGVFALSYVVIQVGRTLCVLFLLGNNHVLSANFKRILGWMCISGVLWICGVYAEGNARLIIWLAAVVCDYFSPMFGFWLPVLGRSDSGREWTIEGSHLAERSQLFVIIAFGETILMTGASLSEMEEWTAPVICAAVISFISSLAMWWIYFDVSSEAGSEKIKKSSNPGKLGLNYHSIHLVLVGALILCAVGDELVVRHPLDKAVHQSVVVLIIGPIIYLLANMAYKWLVNRSIQLSHIAGIIGLLALLPFAYRMDMVWVNGLSVLVFVFIIIWDMCTGKKEAQTKEN